LREGEEAVVQVKAVNHLPRTLSVRTRLALEGGASVKSGGLEAAFSLDKQGEHLLPLTLGAVGATGAATLRVALETKEDVHVGGTEEFDIPLKPSAMPQTFAGAQHDNRLVTPLPEAGKVKEVKIEVSSGLLGAALNAAAVLVSYPYGCTEQLVHTTIPNLVLMDLVRRAGLKTEDLGPLAGVLTKAEKNAGQGIKKIIGNQKTDGGFGLWPSDPQSSLPVTLTALYALKSAGDLKIEGALTAYNRGRDWLNRGEALKLSGGGPMRGYELSRLAEIGSFEQPWDQQIAYVRDFKVKPPFPLPTSSILLRFLPPTKTKAGAALAAP